MSKLTVIVLILASVIVSSETAAGFVVPPEIKKTVTFIFARDENGQLTPRGTGFFVGIKGKNGRNHWYLVTAKHVLQEKGKFLDEVILRVNRREGGVEHIPLSLKEGILFTHRDATVDVAVIRGVPNPEKYDILMLPEEYLTTKERYNSLGITEGDEVFFVGLFTPHYGKHENYPIVRFGRVALITEEKVEWSHKEKVDLYLIESLSSGGNSGAPVFFHLGPLREARAVTIGPPRAALAGIIKGYFGEPIPIKVIEAYDTNGIPVAFANMGITGVVPSYKLHEILFSDELEKLRTVSQ